jgi:hypothetical protein
VESETAVASNSVQDAEAAIIQELRDMTTAQNAWVTTGKPEKLF